MRSGSTIADASQREISTGFIALFEVEYSAQIIIIPSKDLFRAIVLRDNMTTTDRRRQREHPGKTSNLKNLTNPSQFGDAILPQSIKLGVL